MYVIIVYDVNSKRVAKVCKYLRRFLFWVQNSVFEGELTTSQLVELKTGLKSIIKANTDSVMIYKMRNQKWIIKDEIGVNKNAHTNIL